MQSLFQFLLEDTAFLQALASVGYQCARADSAPGDVICTDAGWRIIPTTLLGTKGIATRSKKLVVRIGKSDSKGLKFGINFHQEAKDIKFLDGPRLDSLLDTAILCYAHQMYGCPHKISYPLEE